MEKKLISTPYGYVEEDKVITIEQSYTLST